MTRDRSFKKLVRGRMRKTGESYAAARAQLRRPAPPPHPAHEGGDGMYPFGRFTERAKRVLAMAQAEAERFQQSYIGAEHLLLGLLQDRESLAMVVLGNLGVDIDALRSTVEAAATSGTEPGPETVIPTSRVKKVVELSFEEARRMGHNYVGTEHLLLGILIEGDSLAARTLREAGAELVSVRRELESVLTLRPSDPVGRRERRPPDSAELAALLDGARELAAFEGRSSVGPEHLLLAIAATGTGVGRHVARWDDLTEVSKDIAARAQAVRESRAAKQAAVARQDYTAAAGHHDTEERATEQFRESMAAWRASLE